MTARSAGTQAFENALRRGLTLHDAENAAREAFTAAKIRRTRRPARFAN